jgi:hypothetical protein
MAPQFAGREYDVEEFRALEIIEILRRVLDLVSLPGALVNEAAHRFCIRLAQSGSFLLFFVPVEPRVTSRDEMIPAEPLSQQGGRDTLFAVRDSAVFRSRHSAAR